MSRGRWIGGTATSRPIAPTFFKREPWSRWWVGRDLFGAAREVYVEQSVPDADQVAHIAERLTRPT